MKKILTSLLISATVILTGCIGEHIETSAGWMWVEQETDGSFGKIQSVASTRLDPCPGSVCTTVYKVFTGTQVTDYPGKIFLPESDIEMEITIGVQYNVNPTRDVLLSVITGAGTTKLSSRERYVEVDSVEKKYVSLHVWPALRLALKGYTIEHIMDNQQVVTDEVNAALAATIEAGGIIDITNVTFKKVGYPEFILEKKNAAKGIEDTKELELKSFAADLEIEDTRLQVAQKKATNDVAIDKIVADNMSDGMVKYRLLEAMEQCATNEKQACTMVIGDSMFNKLMK